MKMGYNIVMVDENVLKNIYGLNLSHGYLNEICKKYVRGEI